MYITAVGWLSGCDSMCLQAWWLLWKVKKHENTIHDPLFSICVQVNSSAVLPAMSWKKKSCLDYECLKLMRSFFFFFFCSSLSNSLLRSNSIAIQLKCTIQTFSNWERIPPRYFHEMVFLNFTQLLYAFQVDSNTKWPSVLNDNAKTPDKSCSVKDHNTWVQSNLQKL